MLNPLSTQSFLSWVEKQPPEKRYEHFPPRWCAVGQYATSLGLEYNECRVLDTTTVSKTPRTFGALAERLREEIYECVTLHPRL